MTQIFLICTTLAKSCGQDLGLCSQISVALVPWFGRQDCGVQPQENETPQLQVPQPRLPGHSPPSKSSTVPPQRHPSPPGPRELVWGQMTHPSLSAENASSLPLPRSWPRKSRSPSPQLLLSPASGLAHVQGSGATRAPHSSSMTRGAGGCPGRHRGGPRGSHGPLPRHSGTPRAPGPGVLCRAKEWAQVTSFHAGRPNPRPFVPGHFLLLWNPQLSPHHLLQQALTQSPKAR